MALAQKHQIDLETGQLFLQPSDFAGEEGAPAEGSKESDDMGDLATLAGLPKGSKVPEGTLKALSAAWKRGNFVRATTKRAEVIDGEQFYACTGNDYRGDFRAVDRVWMQDNGPDKDPTIITKLNYDETAPAPTGMDRDEYMILREAAYMDCSGQANVLADPNHGGRPFVFAGIDKEMRLGPRHFK